MTTKSNPAKKFNFLFGLLLLSFAIAGCENTTPISFSDRMTNLVPSEGSLSPEFSTLVLNYDLIVGENINSITLTPTLDGEDVTVMVNDVAVESGSASQVVALTSNRTEIRVDVASETIDYNYVVTVIKSRAANAFLSDLMLSQGAFLPALEANSVSLSGYAVTVPSLTSSLAITATLADSDASLTINGVAQVSAEASSLIDLVEGINVIDIVVTAQNQVMTQTYQLNVTRSTAEDFALHTYVKATNTDAGDKFGSSVAMWGNTLVVGAPEEDSNATARELDGDQTDNSATGTGAAYIYEKNASGSWQFQSFLKPLGTRSIDLFGKKVAASNNRVAVASIATDIDGNSPNGRIEEFRKNDSNNWVYWAPLGTPRYSISTQLYSFGTDIVLSHKYLIAGFPGDQSPATGIDGDQSATFENLNDISAGAVFIYVDSTLRSGFTLDTYIKASNTGASDLFGYSIALSGNTLAVGAPGEESSATGINGNQLDNSAPDSGAVYIFTYDDITGWTQQAYLKASNTEEGDLFGSSVSLSGDTLVVGAPYEDGYRDNQEGTNRLQSGAAYVFTRDESSNWSQQAYLKPAAFDFQTINGDHFGSGLFISGDTIVTTSPQHDSGVTGIVKGEEVSVDDSSVPVKAFSGSANVFTRDQSNQWSEQYYVKAPNTDESDGFGGSITAFGDQLVLAAKGEDSNAIFNEGGLSDNSADNAGAAYIYDNAPFSNHNLALSIVSTGSSNNRITAINLDTGFALNDCTDNCNQLITRGQTIQLTPMAGDGSSVFVEWQGDEACLSNVDANGVTTVAIIAETFCTAVFIEVDVKLTIDKHISSTADGLIQASINGAAIASCDIGCSSTTSDPLELDSAVQIIATAEAGAFVAAWSGEAECQQNATNLNTVTSVSMAASKTCTALFSFPATRVLRLTVAATGNATGSVSAVNLSTSVDLQGCSTDCSQQITQGHTVQLTPVAGDASSEFLSWSGDSDCASNANGAGVTTVGLDTDTYCAAMFGEIVVEDIILTVSKHASSTADGLIQATSNAAIAVSCDIGCNSDVSAPLVAGSLINFTATPEAGAVVTAWSGDAECQANANSDNTTTSVTVSASKTCTAQFDLIQTNELRLIVANTFDGSGSVSAFNVDTQLAIDGCSNDCSQQVESGQTVRLTPLASVTSEFSHWTGDTACNESVSAEGVSEFLLAANAYCTAHFIETVSVGITLTLSKTTDNTSLDGNMVAIPAFTDRPAIVSCDVGCTSATSGIQNSGDQFDIFASPQDGFASVVEWTGDPQCAANASPDKTSTRVTLTEAITCTARFSAPL